MGASRKRKKKGMGTIAFLGLVILGCLVVIFFIGKGYVKSMVTRKVTEQVTQQVFERALESTGDPRAAEKAKEIVASMDKEDKEQAEEIIGKYADSQTIADCMDIVEGGINEQSISEVKQYLEQSVSEEDMQALQGMYEKYKDELQ